MEFIEVLIAIVVAILGLAYPLLLQIVSSLDTRYSSTKITNLFHNHWTYEWFRWTLWLAVCLVAINFVPIPKAPCPKIAYYFDIVQTVRLILLSVMVGWLLVVFFYYVERALSFINPTLLNNLIFLRIEKKKGASRMIHLSVLSDLLNFHIHNENESTAKTIANFLMGAKEYIGVPTDKGELEYPYEYTSLINSAVRELTLSRNKKFRFLHQPLMFGLLYPKIGEQISAGTRSWLWANLVLAIEADDDDLIIAFWERAHQFFIYNLRYIPKELGPGGVVLNEDEFAKRNEERKTFIDFTKALGGLLLYFKQYDTIARLFRYTTSIPPKYELLPEHMDQIFESFMRFANTYNHDMTWLSHIFYFPNMEGLHSDDTIRDWICKYHAVLFIRQYSIEPYLSFQEPLALPHIPNTQAERRKWIDHLPYFERLINEIFNDKELLKDMNLDFVTDEYCGQRNIPTPPVLIHRILQKTQEAYGVAEIQQPIAEAKRNLFFESSRITVANAIESIKPLNSNLPIDDKARTFATGTINTVMSKAAFAENQGIDYGNYHSILGASLSSKICEDIANTFEFVSSVRYLVKPEELFQAIDRLNLTKDHVLVFLGLDLAYIAGRANVAINNQTYKGITILNPNEVRSGLTRDSVFILKKTDLPSIQIMTGNQQWIDSFNGHEIDTDSHLWATIEDLNLNEELRISIQRENNEELRTSVFMGLHTNIKIGWKQKAKIVKIAVASSFHNQGNPVNVSTIHPFDFEPPAES